ncbi:MAG: sugar phosphate isomerase/epimerase family protein [Anaerolineales bacterium]
MKIGMLTGIWSIAERASLIDSLHRAAALGFHYVDLHGVFHAGPAHLSAKERLAVKAELKSLGLIPRNYVLHPLHNLASATESELEQSLAYLQEGINLATEWGINQLELNAGQWVYGLPKDVSWSKAVRFLQRLCDYAAARDFFIAIESEPYVWFLVNDLASTQRMLSDVDRQNFTVLADLGHLALERQSPQALAQIADVIINAHFSDHKPYLHTNQVIGSGFVPTADYLDMLHRLDIDYRMQRYGYGEMVVSFELGVPGDHIDDPDGWVKQSLQHILEIAPYMSMA